MRRAARIEMTKRSDKSFITIGNARSRLNRNEHPEHRDRSWMSLTKRITQSARRASLLARRQLAVRLKKHGRILEMLFSILLVIFRTDIYILYGYVVHGTIVVYNSTTSKKDGRYDDPLTDRAHYRFLRHCAVRALRRYVIKD